MKRWRERAIGLTVGVAVVVALGVVVWDDDSSDVIVDCDQTREAWGDEPDPLLAERLDDLGC